MEKTSQQEVNRGSVSVVENIHPKSEEVQTQFAEETLNQIDLDALSKQALTWKCRATWRLAVVVAVQGLSVAAFAIDGNVIGGITALPAFREHFNVGTSGTAIGIVMAAMAIGMVIVSPFQWLADIIGRRKVSFIGNIILLVGCVLQAAAPNHACLIVGRILGGAGCAFTATVMPLYMSEIAPAGYRGLVVGLTVSTYSIGSIFIACVLLAASYLEGDWSWRTPMVFQTVPPALVASLIFLCTPESPRYLLAKGKDDEARQIIAKYHTASESLDDPIVIAQIDQIRKSLLLLDTKPWDYSNLYASKSGRYRLWVIFLYSFTQQCNGSGMINYYLSAVLTLVGITNAQQQLGINLGLSIVSWISTIFGSMIVDKVRRRVLLILGMSVLVVFLSLMSLVGGLFAHDIAIRATGILMVIFMFLFNVFNSLFVSVLHNVYPNEVLHYNQRAKGMGAYSLFQNSFGFAMTYGASAALAKLKWKIYFVFIGIDLFNVFITWMYFPEFRHLSLEEIDLVFETPGTNPVKLSKQLQLAKEAKRDEERSNLIRST